MKMKVKKVTWKTNRMLTGKSVLDGENIIYFGKRDLGAQTQKELLLWCVTLTIVIDTKN